MTFVRLWDTSWLIASRKLTDGSPTTSRPFRSRMTTPSRSRRRISKLIGTYSVYRVWLAGMLDDVTQLRLGKRCSFVPIRCGASGQRNGEARALLEFALHIDSAAMCLHDPGDKTQSQPESLLRVGRRNAIKAVEDVRQMVGRTSSTDRKSTRLNS